MITRRLYKFRIHYRRSTGGWTVHFRGQCVQANHLLINTKLKSVIRLEKKTNPRAWLEGFTKDIYFAPGWTVEIVG